MFSFPPIPLSLAGVGSHTAVEEDARLSLEKWGQQSALMTSSDSKSCMDLQKQDFSNGFSPQGAWRFPSRMGSIALGNASSSAIYHLVLPFFAEGKQLPAIYSWKIAYCPSTWIYTHKCVLFKHLFYFDESPSRSETTALRTGAGEQELSSKISPLLQIRVYHHIVKADCKILALKESEQSSVKKSERVR